MLERGALVLGVLALVCLVAFVVRTVARRRVAAVTDQGLPGELRRRWPEGAAGIVYFYGPHCGTCRQQAAILERLSQEGITVVRVDATREAGLAEALAVLTVPTTVIVDSACHIRAVNPGFRSDAVLAAQLHDPAGLAVGTNRANEVWTETVGTRR
jgi:thiol-disulfide isomerase/thioredoxin